uniref:Uncharacterized protein n=3 Tax=Oryza TaxID=4527 RepID=Q2R6E6_ORYSJ|nr:hypothetical protein LOC_Os11g20320 [Oryza sativa Japonica Group]ABA92875.1 hypothetical protein LOC_Os11g20320 [Oryza sativa Japonica Group]
MPHRVTITDIIKIVLIQAHAEKSKVKCQESRPSKAFNGYKPTIDFEVTDHGLSMGTRNH